MKRSEINAAIARAIDLINANRWSLPPWGHWGVSEFAAAADTARFLRDHQMGWDVTDFGSGDFARRGLTLFCVRNGRQDEANGKPYAEKLLIVGEDQETPVHRHRVKMEDIINRAGGTLTLEFAHCDRDGKATDAPVTVSVDGVLRTLSPWEKLRLGARRERDDRAWRLPPLLWREGQRAWCSSARSARSTTTTPTTISSNRSAVSPRSRRTSRRCARYGMKSRRDSPVPELDRRQGRRRPGAGRRAARRDECANFPCRHCERPPELLDPGGKQSGAEGCASRHWIVSSLKLLAMTMLSSERGAAPLGVFCILREKSIS